MRMRGLSDPAPIVARARLATSAFGGLTDIKIVVRDFRY